MYEIRARNELIEIEIKNIMSFKKIKRLIKEISINYKKLRKVLVYNYTDKYLSPLQSLILIKYLDEIRVSRHNKIAIVNLMTINDDNDDFFITATLNRGWYNIKLFYKTADAINWLSDSAK